MNGPQPSNLAKLSVPSVEGLLRRVRPERQLRAMMAHHPVLWLAGPPGSGKTTLLAQLASGSERRTLWYRIDRGDRDHGSFFHYLRLAAHTLAGIDDALPAPLSPQFHVDVAQFARGFFRRLLALLPGPLQLVFDNYQDAGGILDPLLTAAAAELPAGSHLLIASRSAPTPMFVGLLDAGAMSLMGWDDLRADSSEVIALAHRHGQRDPALIQRVDGYSAGWIAGLAVLLEQARVTHSVRPAPLPRGEGLFEYFQTEILDAAPATIRHLLLATALLPGFTLAQAAEFSTPDQAIRALHWLTERFFLLHAQPGETPSYHYQPLFRQALLERGRAELAHEQRRQLLGQAARIARADGNLDQAVALQLEAADWDGAVESLHELCPALLAQGRHQTLVEWVGQIPLPIATAKPWLSYWTGLALLASRPRESRVYLQAAMSAFERSADCNGSLLACSAILQSFYLEMGDQRPGDGWFTRLEQLWLGHFTELALETEVQVIACLTGMQFRHCGTALFRRACTRAEELLALVTDTDALASLAYFVLAYCLAHGHWQRGRQLIRRVAPTLDPAPLTPLRARQWSLAKLFWHAMHMRADAEAEARAEIRRFAELGDASGVRVLEIVGISYSMTIALKLRDTALANALQQRARQFSAGGRTIDLSHLALFDAMLCLDRGDVAAIEHSRRALQLSEDAGAYLHVYFIRVLLIQALAMGGERAAALAESEQLLAFSETSGCLRHAALLLHAYVLMKHGRHQEAVARVRQGLAISREESQASIEPRVHERVTAEIYAFALDHDIEPDFVLNAIAHLKLAPPADASDRWPWPVKIYTLGRFEVRIDGQELQPASGMQLKPMELLRLLLSRGAPAMAVDEVIATLWNRRGRSVRSAFDVTLLRLRKLLRRGDALLIRDGEIALNRHLCWVDIWMFDRLTAPALDPCGTAVRNGLTLYQGTFLPGEMSKPWTTTVRERFRTQYQAAVLEAGSALEAGGQHAAAADIYRLAADAEPLTEEFYYRLMLCQYHMDQPAAAQQTYCECQERISRSLNARPSERLNQLYARVRASPP